MTKPYTVEAVVHAPANSVRAHAHPILEAGNLSFPKGRYLLDFMAGKDRSSYIITHRIEGAPLIDRLLKTKRAGYVCIVSSPMSAYRETHVSLNPSQEVRWDPEDLGEPPMFTPGITCMKPVTITLDSSRDGVHEIWDKQHIELNKGSRLALGSVIQLESSIMHLLSLHVDEQLKEGQFAVDIETEPFRFRVNVSRNLHRYLHHRHNENRSNIMTHIVTACLARLQKDHNHDDGETGWESHPNLRALDEFLRSRGLEHWADDDFRPEKVATALHPHVFRTEGTEESGESNET